MTNFFPEFKALAGNIVFTNRPRLRDALLDSLKEDCDSASLADWLARNLPDFKPFVKDREEARALVSYILDFYWLAKGPAHIADIQECTTDLALRPYWNRPVGNLDSCLSDSISASTKRLQFLHDSLLPQLHQTFAACFLVGSLNYGRFYSTRDAKDSNASDIDLFLVCEPKELTWDDIEDVGLVSKSLLRASAIARTFNTASHSLISCRFKKPQEDYDVSLTIGATKHLSEIFSIDSKEPCLSTLNREVSTKGKPSLVKDMTGSPFEEPYTETASEKSFFVSIPNYVPKNGFKNICGLATLFLPRTEILYGTPEIERMATRFSRAVQEVKHSMEQQGLACDLSHIHPREGRFSPLFKESMRHVWK